MDWKLLLRGRANRNGEPSFYVQDFDLKFYEDDYGGENAFETASMWGHYLPCALICNEGVNLYDVADAHSQGMHEIISDVTAQQTDEDGDKTIKIGYFRESLDLAEPTGDLVYVESIDWKVKGSYFAENMMSRRTLIHELQSCFPAAGLIAIHEEALVEKYNSDDQMVLSIRRLTDSSLFVIDPNRVSKFDQEMKVG